MFGISGIWRGGQAARPACVEEIRVFVNMRNLKNIRTICGAVVRRGLLLAITGILEA